MLAVNEAKAEFARLINADARDIAAMSCVSDIASSIGSALDFQPGKNAIVVGEVDSPSMGHVWLAHERKGAAVRFVATDADHCLCTEAYRSARLGSLVQNPHHENRYRISKCGWIVSPAPPRLLRKVANASIVQIACLHKNRGGSREIMCRQHHVPAQCCSKSMVKGPPA